jgi:2-polyprenyl-6-methoxyphenol hydroxylase-like FAD-dependent oxidoreductase
MEMPADMFGGEGIVAEIEIARGDLAQVLLDQLGAAAGVRPDVLDLRYGDHVTAVARDDAGVDVEFARAPGARFDVLVGADGVHSATRRLVFGPEERFATYLGGYAAFFTMPTPAGLEEGWFALRFVPGATFGIRPDRDPRTSKAILTLRMDRDPSLRGDRTAQEALIRSRIGDAGWHAPAVLAALGEASDLYFDELVRIDVPDVALGRVVLLGDAASCGSPMTGQGTATALIGAYLLAQHLSATPGDVVGALRRFSADIAPFAHHGKQIPGGGIKRMVPATRFEAGVSRVLTRVLMSRAALPLVKRMFAAGSAELALPEVAVPVS